METEAVAGQGADRAVNCLLLSAGQVLEDVSEEHARKTITMEPHPHGPGWVQAASIHPCRHANVMHKLSEVVAGEGAEFKIEK